MLMGDVPDAPCRSAEMDQRYIMVTILSNPSESADRRFSSSMKHKFCNLNSPPGGIEFFCGFDKNLCVASYNKEVQWAVPMGNVPPK